LDVPAIGGRPQARCYEHSVRHPTRFRSRFTLRATTDNFRTGLSRR
jgi:hypothetical protein